MKNLFVAMVLILTTQAAQAQLRNAYVKKSGSVSKVSDARLEKEFNSIPVCIKDGSRIFAVNQLWSDAGYSYADCSKNGAANKARLTGKTLKAYTTKQISAKAYKALGGK